MYLIDDNTRRCVGVIDVVRMDSPDIMGGVIHRETSIEVILDTGRELEFLAKDLYVDSVHNYHIRKMDTKKDTYSGNRFHQACHLQPSGHDRVLVGRKEDCCEVQQE